MAGEQPTPDFNQLHQLPKTAAEARATGALHYCTGEPCSNGHIARRLITNRQRQGLHSWQCSYY
jgi:hypothetical protein